MNKMETFNTKRKGFIDFLIIKKEDGYLGVCLTFNIVQEGKDPVAITSSLREAAKLHLETVIEKDLPDTLLNRSAPAKYWKLYEKARQTAMTSRQRASFFTSSVPYPDFLDACVMA